MVDSIVSVRMPSSLVQKLKSLSKENHYLDVSEELRSIIRTKTQEYKSADLPPTKSSGRQPPKGLRDDAKDELVKKLKDLIKELEAERK